MNMSIKEIIIKNEQSRLCSKISYRCPNTGRSGCNKLNIAQFIFRHQFDIFLPFGCALRDLMLQNIESIIHFTLFACRILISNFIDMTTYTSKRLSRVSRLDSFTTISEWWFDSVTVLLVTKFVSFFFCEWSSQAHLRRFVFFSTAYFDLKYTFYFLIHTIKYHSI